MASNEKMGKNGYVYPMDEAKEIITPELVNALKKFNQTANQGYVYGQQNVTQSLSTIAPDEVVQCKLKAMSSLHNKHSEHYSDSNNYKNNYV